MLLIWWRSGQTLNVENVATVAGEVLFWIAVVFSNSLGTSTGDYLSGGLNVGLRPAALILTAAMLALLAAYYFTNINGTLLFWIAFILTRPWGAVVGNILSKSRDHGGLDWGNAGRLRGAHRRAGGTGGLPDCRHPPSSPGAVADADASRHRTAATAER